MSTFLFPPAVARDDAGLVRRHGRMRPVISGAAACGTADVVALVCAAPMLGGMGVQHAALRGASEWRHGAKRTRRRWTRSGVDPARW